MPRIVYDPKTKVAILAAAKGKKMAEAHEAARAAGYKGGVQSLYIMLRSSGVKWRKRRKTAATQEPLALSNGSGLVEIQRAIEVVVQARVRAAIALAIEKLQSIS